MPANLYRIDDVLLRAGATALLLVLLVAAGAVLADQAAAAERGRPADLGALSRHWRVWIPAFLCPVALLGAGWALRRRERRILAIWSLLRQNALLSVPALVANSAFERSDVERAVRVLNTRGLGHYVWDTRSDTIQDGRLPASQRSIDKCESCGAAVSVQVPFAAREAPRCPYCHGPVCVDALDDRRWEALEALRDEARTRTGRAGAGSFSLGLFLVLLVCFWPAALLYAVHKWQGEMRS